VGEGYYFGSWFLFLFGFKSVWEWIGEKEAGAEINTKSF
jgi:hypothetical protein